jgi:hypothetical protein
MCRDIHLPPVLLFRRTTAASHLCLAARRKVPTRWPRWQDARILPVVTFRHLAGLPSRKQQEVSAFAVIWPWQPAVAEKLATIDGDRTLREVEQDALRSGWRFAMARLRNTLGSLRRHQILANCIYFARLQTGVEAT